MFIFVLSQEVWNNTPSDQAIPPLRKNLKKCAYTCVHKETSKTLLLTTLFVIVLNGNKPNVLQY